MELRETEHTIRESLPCLAIIVGREVSSCLLSSPNSTVKIAIFDDSELLQELHRTTVPERAILTRIMKTLERVHFALVLPGNTNLERIKLSISLGIGFLLGAAVKICALKGEVGKVSKFVFYLRKKTNKIDPSDKSNPILS